MLMAGDFTFVLHVVVVLRDGVLFAPWHSVQPLTLTEDRLWIRSWPAPRLCGVPVEWMPLRAGVCLDAVALAWADHLKQTRRDWASSRWGRGAGESGA